ncbi:MAG: hypothetical protein ACO1SX_15680 [Actinomycetota bacterium]
MERQTTQAQENRLDSWHPGGIIVNLILLSVVVSFVFGLVATMGVIVYVSLH